MLFSVEDFEAEGYTADDRFLIEHMADQEVSHAIAITNVRPPRTILVPLLRCALPLAPTADAHSCRASQMLGVDRAAKQCVYEYPAFNSVKEYIAFNNLLTRWGEAGCVCRLVERARGPARALLTSLPLPLLAASTASSVSSTRARLRRSCSSPSRPRLAR